MHHVRALDGEKPRGDGLLGGSAAADHAFAFDQFGAHVGDARGERGGACADRLRGLTQHGERGHAVPTLQHQIAECGFEHLADELIQAQRAEERIAAQARDQFGASGEEAGLRTAEQFIATERDQVHAGFQALGDERFLDAEGAQVHDAAAPEIFVDGNSRFAAERGEIA